MNWKKLGDNFKSATGVSIASFAVIFGMHGTNIIEALGSLPALYQAFSSKLPMGVWSTFLGMAAAAGFHLFARSWHRKSLSIEVASVMLGTTVVLAQVIDYTAPELLSALAVGLVAGLFGLLLSKMGRAMFTGEEDDESRPDPPLPKPD